MRPGHRHLIASLLVVLAAAMVSSGAEPVDESLRVDLDLRRTTLIVSDMDASLAFYRDALGMLVIYDNQIVTPGNAQAADDVELSRRLVLLRANDDYIGVLGLLHYDKPVKPVREPEPVPFSTGSAVLLYTTDDVDARFRRASRVPGVRVIQPPTDVTYPAYDGSGTIAVRTSNLYDPDGFLVELNQFLGDDGR